VTTTTTTQTSLERRLGPIDAAALIVSNVIGGGILFTPPQIAASVPAALPFLSTWGVGGLLAFAGAMAYAELAALRPHAGGEYVYLREAFGRVAAFLSGWTSFVAGFSGAIATSAVVLASYLGRFAPAAGNSTPLFSLPIVPGLLTLTFSPQAIVAVAAIFGMAWVHLRGVGPGRLVGNALATLKVSALLLFIVFGFSMGNGQAANLTASGSVTPFNAVVPTGSAVKPRFRSDQTLWSTAFVNTAIRGERVRFSSPAGAGAVGTARNSKPAAAAAGPIVAAVVSSKSTVPAGKLTPPELNGAVASFAVRPPCSSAFRVRTAVAESISSA